MNDDLMQAFTEMYIEYCRLKGYKPPKNPIDQMIDNATGAEAAHMKEFAQWLREEILPRWKLA